ncbi:MAG: DUF3221 domain-containing protein [Acidimicrobiales bacterium]
MTLGVGLTSLVVCGVLGCGRSSDEVSSGGPLTTPTTPTADEGDGPAQPGPPDEPADISGPVTSVTPFAAGDCPEPDDLPPDAAVSSDDAPPCGPAGSGTVGSVLIEQGTGSYDAASVTVAIDTLLLGPDGSGGWLPIAFDRIGDGARVRVWFTGGIAESYPVQTTAAVITLEP